VCQNELLVLREAHSPMMTHPRIDSKTGTLEEIDEPAEEKRW
jgi:hypothetical protein